MTVFHILHKISFWNFIPFFSKVLILCLFSFWAQSSIAFKQINELIWLNGLSPPQPSLFFSHLLYRDYKSSSLLFMFPFCCFQSFWQNHKMFTMKETLAISKFTTSHFKRKNWTVIKLMEFCSLAFLNLSSLSLPLSLLLLLSSCVCVWYIKGWVKPGSFYFLHS